jgi:hypothetical protein
VATAALVVLQWFIWMPVNSLVQIEDYVYYFSLPVAIELAVAYVLARGYSVHGEPRILVFGDAALISGLIGVMGIFLSFVEVSLAPSVAASSMGGLLFSALNFFGAFQFMRRASSDSAHWKSRLAVAYAAGGVTVALLGYFALNGLGPAFFGAPGVGMHNLLYEAFSASAMILLFASSILLFAKGSVDPEARFVGWYAAGLALAALLYLPIWLNLPSSSEFTFLEGSTYLAAGACALVFAFVYLHKTRLNTAVHS